MNPLLLSGLFSMGQSLIERFFPDPEKQSAARLELLKMQQSGELAALASETDLAKAQLLVNQGSQQVEIHPTVRAERIGAGGFNGAALQFQALNAEVTLPSAHTDAAPTLAVVRSGLPLHIEIAAAEAGGTRG